MNKQNYCIVAVDISNIAEMKHMKLIYSIVAFLLVFLGFIIGFYTFILSGKADDSESGNNYVPYRKEGLSGYKFINPLLDCEGSSSLIDTRIASIKHDISLAVAEEKKKSHIDEISLYYRDLNNGPWFGIDEDMPFSPASLLKVPVAMAIYDKAMKDPSFLSQEVLFGLHSEVPDMGYGENLPSIYLPPDIMPENTKYTLNDLTFRALAYSDNSAYFTILKAVDYEKLESIHTELGLVYPNDTTKDDYVSVRAYSSLFRVLYNASYLDREYSEKLLEILSSSTFTQGLVNELPAGTVVAHKFGIRGNDAASNQMQLHDCGIIYHPDSPYLLCIMTRGPELEPLADSISGLSKKIYDLVTDNY